jgi:hypothetical protein
MYIPFLKPCRPFRDAAEAEKVREEERVRVWGFVYFICTI